MHVRIILYGILVGIVAIAAAFSATTFISNYFHTPESATADEIAETLLPEANSDEAVPNGVPLENNFTSPDGFYTASLQYEFADNNGQAIEKVVCKLYNSPCRLRHIYLTVSERGNSARHEVDLLPLIVVPESKDDHISYYISYEYVNNYRGREANLAVLYGLVQPDYDIRNREYEPTIIGWDARGQKIYGALSTYAVSGDPPLSGPRIFFSYNVRANELHSDEASGIIVGDLNKTVNVNRALAVVADMQGGPGGEKPNPSIDISVRDLEHKVNYPVTSITWADWFDNKANTAEGHDGWWCEGWWPIACPPEELNARWINDESFELLDPVTGKMKLYNISDIQARSLPTTNFIRSEIYESNSDMYSDISACPKFVPSAHNPIEYAVTPIDLNNDTIPEVQVAPIWVCGHIILGASGNGPLWIYEKRGEQWVRIYEGGGNVFNVLNQYTNGYRDIESNWHLSAGSSGVTLQQWNTEIKKYHIVREWVDTFNDN